MAQAQAIFEEAASVRPAPARCCRQARAKPSSSRALAYDTDTKKALLAYSRATDLDPSDTWSWIFLGRLQARAGNLEKAADAARHAYETARAAGLERDVGVARNELADVLVSQGDLAGALEAYEDGLGIFEKLAAADPGNAGWQRDLSVGWNEVGDVRQAQGDLAGALEAWSTPTPSGERLAASDPGNAAWQRDLSVSWERIGDVPGPRATSRGRSRPTRRPRHHRRISPPPTQAMPAWQRDLSVSWNKVGDVRRAQGDLAGAPGLRGQPRHPPEARRRRPRQCRLAARPLVSWNKSAMCGWPRATSRGRSQAYEDSLAIRQQLAAADPGDAEWQRDLAVSWDKVGDVRGAQGDLAGALRPRGEPSIFEHLAASDPGISRQRYSALSDGRVGMVQARQGEPANARALGGDGTSSRGSCDGHQIMLRCPRSNGFDAQIAKLGE